MAIRVSCEDGAPEVVGSHILLAVGRVPNTDDLGLDNAGIGVDPRGFISVDDDPRRISDRIPSYGLFIDPPLGRIGMTEREAQ